MFRCIWNGVECFCLVSGVVLFMMIICELGGVVVGDELVG